MSKFAVFLYQGGGCDYTIACGQKLVMLPDSIETMEDALRYVLEEEQDGCVQYHGNRIDSIVIHEIIDSYEVDMNSIAADREQLIQSAAKEQRRKQFEKLKQEFEL